MRNWVAKRRNMCTVSFNCIDIRWRSWGRQMQTLRSISQCRWRRYVCSCLATLSDAQFHCSRSGSRCPESRTCRCCGTAYRPASPVRTCWTPGVDRSRTGGSQGRLRTPKRSHVIVYMQAVEKSTSITRVEAKKMKLVSSHRRLCRNPTVWTPLNVFCIRRRPRVLSADVGARDRLQRPYRRVAILQLTSLQWARISWKFLPLTFFCRFGNSQTGYCISGYLHFTFYPRCKLAALVFRVMFKLLIESDCCHHR